MAKSLYGQYGFEEIVPSGGKGTGNDGQMGLTGVGGVLRKEMMDLRLTLEILEALARFDTECRLSDDQEWASIRYAIDV